ncbi:MAG: methionyl-tRNA formyltransferase [Spirochaetaceae bacterium]|nr:methionyl-tRNA formyltransferase [Spirochaetaceae bacterium]
MKIIFAGTPAIAIPSLKAISKIHAANGGFCELAGVLTNPDTAKGRHGGSTPSELGAAAQKILQDMTASGRTPFAILKSARIDENCFRSVAAINADILVSFAYGTIFPPEFLAIFPMGGINVHPSLLPKYRGATPIPAAILNRDRETGISIQRLAQKTDCGNILAQERITLTGRETSAGLSVITGEKSAALLVETLRAIAEGTVSETEQNHAEAVFCGKLEREDGRIDWRKSAIDIDAQIRAFTPWPLSYTWHCGIELYIIEAAPYYGNFTLPDGASAGTVSMTAGAEWGGLAGGASEAALDTASGRAKSTAAPGTVLGFDKSAGIIIQTGDGLLAVSRLQYRARKALDWKAFLNGAKEFIGAVLE